MESKYLISIIVPTKNRTEYALKTISQILSINESSIQLVIQDNSDTNKLQKLLRPFHNDSRLRYNYSSELLSFVDNFSVAVSLSEGEYICLIGDDDGINPEILKVARWASRNNVNAIKPSLQAIYVWPNAGISIKNKNMDTGIMNISKITGDVRICDTNTELVKLLNNGCQNYLKLDMVKLYHGIVKKSCMEEIKDKTGKYFGGLSPDIYSAVSLSISIDKVVSIDYPLTISGICKQSGSADSATGKHTGKLEDAPHFKGHSKYCWSEEVPMFYSVETIWADSAITATKDMGRLDLINEFKLEVLTAYSLKSYKQFSTIIKSHYENYSFAKNINKNIQKFKLIKAYIEGPTMDLINRIKNRLIRKKGDLVRLHNIKDISQAEKELSLYLLNHGLNIETSITELDRKYNQLKR